MRNEIPDFTDYPRRRRKGGGPSELASSDIVSYGYDMNKDMEERPSANFLSIFETFDLSLLIVIAVTNSAEGFRRLLELGLYITFKDKLGLEPGEITFLLSIMALPWVLKIFMAMITDNISLFGSRRRNYLILNAALNIVFIIMLMVWGVQ